MSAASAFDVQCEISEFCDVHGKRLAKAPESVVLSLDSRQSDGSMSSRPSDLSRSLSKTSRGMSYA